MKAERINIRLTEKDKQEIIEAANKHKMTLSEFIIRAVLKEVHNNELL